LAAIVFEIILLARLPENIEKRLSKIKIFRCFFSVFPKKITRSTKIWFGLIRFEIMLNSLEKNKEKITVIFFFFIYRSWLSWLVIPRLAESPFGRNSVGRITYVAESPIWPKMTEWTTIRASFGPLCHFRPILYRYKWDLFQPRLHAWSHTSFLLQKGKFCVFWEKVLKMPWIIKINFFLIGSRMLVIVLI
jgi:hypothetical protein